MYAEDAIKPAEALHIVTKLFLIKTSEERGKTLYNLRSVLDYKEDYQNADTQEEREEIEEEIYDYLATCLENVDTDLLYPEDQTISRNLSVTTLFDIIEELYNYTLDNIPVEKKGSAFDSFLNTTLKGRELGQFFTHRNVVNFMVDIADPDLSDKVIDPACGTGGFIETAFIELKEQLDSVFNNTSEEYQQKLEQLKNEQIFGIDKDGNIASLAKLSMSMNGDGHTTIYKGNGLTFENDKIKEESFEFGLTNPPFGSKSVVQVKDNEILSEFELGRKWSFDGRKDKYVNTGELREGQDIGVLFLERCIDLLEEGGKLGIILHDGIFANSTTGYVRQYIREKCKINAVVKLSDETFEPYSDSGGAEASVLICEKNEEADNGECFFAVSDNVGYEMKKNKMVDAPDDLPEIKEAYLDGKEIESGRRVDLSEMKKHERLDAQFHCKEIEFNDADEIISLEELLNGDLGSGYGWSSDNFGEGSKPLVKIRHLNDGLLKKDNLETIPEEVYEEGNTTDLEPGDILLAMDGGDKGFSVSYIDEAMTDIAVNQRVSIIRVDKDKISAAYVFFVLISDVGQEQLTKKRTQTATVAHLSNGQIKEVKIPMLDDEVMEKVDRNFMSYIESVRETQEIFGEMSEVF
jgi:type I restriction enzyme M protein